MSSSEEAQLRFARHYLRVLEECGSAHSRGGDEARDAIQRYGMEEDNITAARQLVLRHAGSSETWRDLAVEFANAGRGILTIQTPLQDQLEWTGMLLEAATAAGRVGRRSTLLSAMGCTLARADRLEEALAHHEAALAIAREHEVPEDELYDLAEIATLHLRMRRYAEAERRFEEVCEIANRLGDRHALACSLSNRATGRFDLRDYGAAARLAAEAYKMFLEEKDEDGAFGALLTMGISLGSLWHFEPAFAAMEEAFDIAERRGDLPGQRAAFSAMGMTLEHEGDYRQAIIAHVKALDLARSIGDDGAEDSALFNLALIYEKIGDPRRALKLLRQRLAKAVASNNHWDEATTVGTMGTVHLTAGRVSSAIRELRRSARIWRKLDAPANEAIAMNALGRALTARGDPAAAIACLERSVVLARRSGELAVEARSLRDGALARWNLGWGDEAIHLMERARQLANDLEAPFVEGIEELLNTWRAEFSVGALHQIAPQ